MSEDWKETNWEIKSGKSSYKSGIWIRQWFRTILFVNPMFLSFYVTISDINFLLRELYIQNP